MTYSEWVHAHRQQFIEGEYDLREILALSFAVGDWTLDEMKRSLHHWPRGLWVKDPEAASDRVAKQTADHFAETIRRINGLSLEDKWHRAMDYQNGKDE